MVVDEQGIPNPIYVGKPHQETYLYDNIHRTQIAGMSVFATVRNPYAWLLSWFDFMGGFAAENPHRQQPEHLLAQTGFENFVMTIITRDDYWPSKKFLFFQLFAQPSGNLIVDHILHTENLNDEFDAATGYTGKHRRDKRGKRHKRGFTTGEWYDRFPGLADRVFVVYHREFWLYGYSKDPHYQKHFEKDAMLTGNVLDKQGHIWYDWEDDELGVGRKVFGANHRRC